VHERLEAVHQVLALLPTRPNQVGVVGEGDVD